MPFVNAVTELKLAGKTLILPVVSTANVAQLAVDLLISSLGLRRVAVLDSRYFIPVVGSRESGEQGVTTPFELYGKDGTEFLVIQQRSPALKTKKQEFLDDLFDFIQKSGIVAVLLLSGIDLSNRTDDQMLTPTYQLQPLKTPTLVSSPLHRLTTFPIPTYRSPVLQGQNSDDESSKDRAIPFIPGGGLTRRILSSLPNSWSIPTAALLRFALDGDNRADAYSLASLVVQVVALESDVSEWKQPESWAGLFGTPHDQTLYG